MLQELFHRCVSELCSEEFNRLTFLKMAAELAPKAQAKAGLLVVHSLYLFLYGQQFKRSLGCIEQGLSLKPQDVTVSILLAIKGVVLSHMEKHSQALHSLKQAFGIASSAIFIEEQPHIRKIYPQVMAKVISVLNISRGRRQFLVFLQNIRVQASNLNGLEEVERTTAAKVSEIRELMRCGCREQTEGRTMQTNQFNMTKKQGVSHTSIYINKLYEERKATLGKRDSSASKRKTYDPSQWRMKEKESQVQCQYM